jgi:transcriptional regulator with GAF, ATPase, and Fis domain
MVGQSLQIRRVREFIDRVAPSEATVLVYGESGTGKELVARAVHENSRRARGPFVAVNCAALPEHLIESELFGHTKGAFSGALYDKKGKMELADGGTLFLDEIGELPLALQPKLLRALEEREFDRLGATRSTRVNVRVIAATNADLRSSVSSGRFRPDLFFRLDVVSLRTPPLRERREDIPMLAAHFAARCGAQLQRNVSGIAPDALQALLGYSWPGNVRELQNAIERATVLGSNELISVEDLPEIVRDGERALPVDASFRAAVRQFKRQLILSAISAAEGNLTQAARMLAVDPNYLHRLIRVLNLRDALKRSAGVRPRAQRAEPEPRLVVPALPEKFGGESAAASTGL